jgi:hypothetical protein
VFTTNNLSTARITVTLPQLNGNAKSATTGDDAQAPAVLRSFEDEWVARHNHELWEAGPDGIFSWRGQADGFFKGGV